MAAPDPNGRSREGNRDIDEEVDEVHKSIERCIQMYMDREEAARELETHFGTDRRLTRLVWDKLQEDNPEFFQAYYTRLVLKRQIERFNELLEQQHQAMRAMNIPLVPTEQQTSMELAETAPQAGSSVSITADSSVSMTDNENEAESNKQPANPISFVRSEEVAGSNPNLVPGGGLAQSSSEGEGVRTNVALDTAHMPSSQALNLIAGVRHTANFRGPSQPSSSRARSLSHLDSNPEASDQKDPANSASGPGSPSADL